MKRLLPIVLSFIACFAFSPFALAEEVTRDVDIACNTCGLCPAPLGICLFYYIIAILIIIIAIVFFTGRGKRCPLCKANCKKSEYVCSKCGYDFESGLQSTLTIRVEDSPELMALRDQNKTPDSSATIGEESVEPVAATQPKAEAPPKSPEPPKAPKSSEFLSDDTIKQARVKLSLETPKVSNESGTNTSAPSPTIKPVQGEAADLTKLQPTDSGAVAEEIKPLLEQKICPHCGVVLNPKAMFCGKCGRKLD